MARSRKIPKRTNNRLSTTDPLDAAELELYRSLKEKVNSFRASAREYSIFMDLNSRFLINAQK